MSKSKRRNRRRQEKPNQEPPRPQSTGTVTPLKQENSAPGSLTPSSSVAINVTSGGQVILSNGADLISKGTSSGNTKLRYAEIKPHELQALVPLITDFFKEVKYEKAARDPWPVINQMYKEMMRNPYSIVYVCVDQDIKPHGYCWFRIEQNVWGESFITIEHDYVIAEHRGTFKEARIHREFINYIIEIGERCNARYVNTAVKTKRLEASRMKLGFKPVELKMTFEGTAAEFRNQNPSFQKYGGYEEQEVNDDGWQGRTDEAGG